MSHLLSAITISDPSEQLPEAAHQNSTRNQNGPPDVNSITNALSELSAGDDHRSSPISHNEQVQQSLNDLSQLQSVINTSILSFQYPSYLKFASDPKALGEFHPSPSLEPNSGPQALTPQDKINQPFLRHQSHLLELSQQVDAVDSYGDEEVRKHRKKLIDRIQQEHYALDIFKEKEWKRQESEPMEVNKATNVEVTGKTAFCYRMPSSHNTQDSYYAQKHSRWHPIILACYIVLVITHVIFRLPRRASAVLLAGIHCIVRLAAQFNSVSGTQRTNRELERLLADIPNDPKSMIKHLDIDPQTVSYVCCPRCFALYDTTQDPRPDICTHRATSESEPCGASLLRKRKIRGKIHITPIRQYTTQGLRKWMGRLLSRDDLESIMDDYPSQTSATGMAHDIWHGSTLKSFKGPDGKVFFDSNGESVEGRLVFGLNVDGFNPFRSEKKVASVTGIYMVCYNLPPDLRYRPENMFVVGIIPGPHKPSLDQINHFLKPLVNELLEFWEPGIFFTKTARYPAGRLVRAVLIPVVCDAVGARQVAGFSAATSKYMCMQCRLQLDDIENFDRSTWPRADLARHRTHAEAFKHAKTVTDQEVLAQEHGIRWSELLRLPYWDPIHFTVVDSMHNLYLGLLQDHCREVWGIDISVEESGDGLSSHKKAMPPRPTSQEIEKAFSTAKTLNAKTLERCGRPSLWHLCHDLNLRRGGTRRQMAKELIKHFEVICFHFPTRRFLTNLQAIASANGSITASHSEEEIRPRQQASTSSTREEPLDDVIAEAKQELLRSKKLDTYVRKYNITILRALCRRVGLSDEGIKRVLVSRLFEWVSTTTWQSRRASTEWSISSGWPMVMSTPKETRFLVTPIGAKNVLVPLAKRSWEKKS